MKDLKSDYLTVQEVADELGVTDARVRQIILAGDLPATRVGQRLLIVSQRDFQRFQKTRQ